MDEEKKNAVTVEGSEENKAKPRRWYHTAVEPGVFFVMLGYSTLLVTTQNLIIHKVCRIQFGQPDYVCDNIANYSINSKVQKIVSDYSLYKSLIEIIPSILYAIFLGSWSYKHGRKGPMILSSAGFFFSTVATAVAGSLPRAPAYYLLLSPVVMSLTGGMASFFMSIFSMVSDVVPSEKRTRRLALVDGALFGAIPVGIVISGAIFNDYGFTPIYYLSYAFQLAGFFYLVFFIKETVVPPEEVDIKTKILDLFDISNFQRSLLVCFQKREGRTRLYIILLILTLILLLLPLMGESSFNFLYVQKKFKWSQADFSYYNGISAVIGTVGFISLIPILTRVFKMTDIMLGIIGTFMKVISNIILAFITVGSLMYVVSCFNLFLPLCLPVVRSQMSKLVGPGELGKMFAVVGAFESGVPLLSSAIYSQLYNSSVDTFPGLVYILSALFLGLSCLSFVFIYFDKKRWESYSRLLEDSDQGPPSDSSSPPSEDPPLEKGSEKNREKFSVNS